MGQGQAKSAGRSSTQGVGPASGSAPALALQQVMDAHVAAYHSDETPVPVEDVAAEQTAEKPAVAETFGSFPVTVMDLRRYIEIALVAYLLYQLMVHHKTIVSKAKKLLKL